LSTTVWAEEDASTLVPTKGPGAGMDMDVAEPKYMSSATALFSCHANPKYFLFHPSHRIFKRMHGVLNVGKKNN
jgi:hypothetical protein